MASVVATTHLNTPLLPIALATAAVQNVATVPVIR